MYIKDKIDFKESELDERLSEMLYDLFYLEVINSEEQYMTYFQILHDSGFSKEDALSIVTYLISQDQVLN